MQHLTSKTAGHALLHAAAAMLCLGSLVAAAQTLPAQTWVTTWGSSQTAPYGQERLPRDAFEGATLRQVVRTSVGGTRLRLSLANTFGDEPLVVHAVGVAIRPAANQGGNLYGARTLPVTFHGASGIVVPMQSELLSDPLDTPLPAGADLVVTMVIDHAPELPTVHAGARATAYLLPGDHAADAVLTGAKTVTRWYFLSGVEVSGTRATGSIVTLGDSITDGHGATTDGNDRWPDFLARHLQTQPGGSTLGVVNQGIGGNCILSTCIGPPAMARFDRDVLAQTGVRYLIVLEGINDIGGLDRAQEHPQADHDALVARLEMALTQMALRAHAHAIRIFGATLTPFAGNGYYHPSARTDADRQALNQWIRTTPLLDGVVDFDKLASDPANPGHMLPAYDSGDHLHPGPEGYRAIGQAVSLTLFSTPQAGSTK